MSANRYIAYFDKIILGLLFIFFVCEHHVKFTAVKNISLYLALLLALILFFLQKSYRLELLKQNFKNAKFPLIFLSIFVIYALVISAFPYTDEFDSLKECFKEFGRGIAFLFIILVLADGKNRESKIFFYAILSAFVLISAYYFFDALPNLEHLKDMTQYGEAGRIVKRAYAPYADRFAVFAFLAVVLFRLKWVKISLVLFCIIFICMDILTGARGSWLAVGVAFLLSILFLMFSSYREIFRRNLKSIIAFGLAFSVMLGVLIANSSIFSYKFSQGASSSGRDLILKQRLPLLMDSERAFWGIGYGFRVYDKFLEDKSAEKKVKISMMSITDTGRKHWFNDEPFFIGNYYYYGAIGTGALFLSFVALLIASFREFCVTQNLFFAMIFITLVSYFGVRGLFETMNLRILYLFYVLGFFILVKAKNEK